MNQDSLTRNEEAFSLMSCDETEVLCLAERAYIIRSPTRPGANIITFTLLTFASNLVNDLSHER